MAEPYTHYRQMSAEILASGGTSNEARWWSTTAWWEERKKLSDGADFRDDAPVPDTAYEGYDHARLKQMLTEGLSVSQVSDVSEAWSKLANAMARFGERLRAETTKAEAVWQGEAADAAKAYTGAMARWSEETGQYAQLVSHQVSMQGDAASTARDRMPDPVPFDLAQEMSGWQSNPQDLNAAVLRTLQQQQAHQDAKQEAVVVMTDYDNNLHTAAARQPTFPPPPKLASAGEQSAAATVAPAASSTGAAAPGSATTAAGFAPGGGADPAGPVPARELAAGRGVGRTNPSMPFHSGGAGVPGATGPIGQGRAGMPPGFMGAPGAKSRGEDDKEHVNSYVVEDWDGEDDWYDDLPLPVSPVIGGENPEQPERSS